MFNLNCTCKLKAGGCALLASIVLIAGVSPSEAQITQGTEVLYAPSAPTLDKAIVYPGDVLNASASYHNLMPSSAIVRTIALTARPPGGSNAGGPYYDFAPVLRAITVESGKTLEFSAARAFTDRDPRGTWYVYATYQDASLAWHDGPIVQFTLTDRSVNQPPSVSARGDQTITFPESVNLAGAASDDGLPAGALTTSWSQVAGPGVVTFANPSALETTATFSAAGSYTLRLTASDGVLSSASDVSVTVNSTHALVPVGPPALAKSVLSPGETLNAVITYQNPAPVPVLVTALVITARPPGGTNSGGPYYDLSPVLRMVTLQPGETIQVAGTILLPTAAPMGRWYAFGTYQDALLAWHDGPSVEFTVSPPPVNKAPSVSAGPSQTITWPDGATLSGAANDDGLPAGSGLTSAWSQFSGPGFASFGDIHALSTTAKFSSAGNYVLRLTASDGELSSVSDVSVTVNPAVTSLSIASPLTLDRNVVSAGQSVNAAIVYKNDAAWPVTVNRVVISARPPGGSNAEGPYYDFKPVMGATTVAPGATLQVSASLAFTGSEPTGSWYAYATYQDSSLVWHDGPSVDFTVSYVKGYYVSNSGNDANAGNSPSAAWRTMAKVQSFLGNLRPGDNVLFERGGIWYEQLNVNNVNGSPGSPITFGNYGAGPLPIIDGGGVKSGYAVNGGREWCIGGRSSKMSYVTIDGFECRNTSSYGIAFVGVAGGSAGIVVHNSYIHDTGNGDVGYHNQLMFAEYNYGHDYGTKFLNNVVGNCFGHNCIQIHGDTGGPIIQGNECYGWSHNCIDVKYVQGALVDNNVAHDALNIQQYRDAFYLENGAASYTADVTWTRNVVYGANITTAFQCEDAGGPVTCRMYNNTVYADATGVFGGSVSGDLSRISIHACNNILDTPRPRAGGGYRTWDYNDLVQSSPIGPNDVRMDPLYVNAPARNFRLQSVSPVIDRGAVVGLPYIAGAPDLGAFEYGMP